MLESSLILAKELDRRAFLEVQFKDEAGTGLGPTLEFYYNIACEIKNAQLNNSFKIWRQNMSDNTLLPTPISVIKMSGDDLQKIYVLFRLAGIMVAKSISDERLIDLPISNVFWDLLLGKVILINSTYACRKGLYLT